MEDAGQAKGVSQRVGVGQLAGVGERLAVPRQGLLGITEHDRARGTSHDRADHARVEGVDEGRAAVPHGVVEGERRLEVVAALGQPPELVQGGPDDAVAGHLCGGLALLLGRAQQLPRDLVRHGQLAALEVDDEAPVQGREELRDVAQLAAQLASPGVGAPRLRRREAPRGDRRLAQRELQAELASLTFGSAGQARQHLQPLGQVRDRLGHRGARERPLPGPLPVVDRLLGEPRLGAVPGEQLGLRLGRLGEALLQRPGDPGVQLAAAAP